ncbi:tRNA pseudouridine synthase A [Ornithinimicrobium pratense]|uniref:tRNA pseudouridine synthase A n=1 Tax=Ornithinimicrobium pratense TaxID=2593973 RepID=A0A5J6V7I6_9MICO|nr:tRNA pseudouridine synthase A [Ornithinimicrobium pratense]QFG69294.1 tRNA pseudouridine(38-40) synthase TruA [Ornithinimicrobium pratense]
MGAVRVRLDFAYDGTDFSGWARQPGLRTVEGELAGALGTVLRVPPPRLTVGGRTDAGVHARGSVCHLDVSEGVWGALPGRSDRTPGVALVVRLRGVLPEDVVVRAATEVPEAFDARFSALRRRYTYRICDRAERLDPLRRRDTVVVRRPLEVSAMDAAARSLEGLRDFAAFCRPRAGATTVRTLLRHTWRRDEEGILVGTVEADAFCHSMVRALVGSVVPVGEGRRPVTWPEEVAERALRDPGVQVMPAHGLCLEEITYPEGAQALAARDQESRAVRFLPEQ